MMRLIIEIALLQVNIVSHYMYIIWTKYWVYKKEFNFLWCNFFCLSFSIHTTTPYLNLRPPSWFPEYSFDCFEQILWIYTMSDRKAFSCAYWNIHGICTHNIYKKLCYIYRNTSDKRKMKINIKMNIQEPQRPKRIELERTFQ